MSRHQSALLACAVGIGTSHRLFGIRTSFCISQLQLSSQLFLLGGLLRISAPWLPKGVKKTELKNQMDPKEVSQMLGYLKMPCFAEIQG